MATAVLGANDAVPRLCDCVLHFDLRQHKTLTLVKCFEFEPGTNFFFFLVLPSLSLTCFYSFLKMLKSAVFDWYIDVLSAVLPQLQEGLL